MTQDTTFAIRRAADRGKNHFGWLDTKHTFSFGQYFDPHWMGYRGLRVINEDVVAAGAGFGEHGHQDMEILSWVLDGELEHADSTGGGGKLTPGMIQYMSAGSGVRHSEMNGSKEQLVHFLQIWIEPTSKGGEPRYGERDVSGEVEGRFVQVAGPDGAFEDGAFGIRADARLSIARLEAGQSIEVPVALGRHMWLHVARGAVQLGDETVGAGDGAHGLVSDTVTIQAIEASEVLAFDLA